MCVILVPTTNHPSTKTLAAAENSNPHGAGIAWKNKKGTLSYEKAIDAARVLEIIKKENPPLPYIIHFRIASIGDVCPKLTHPFPVNKKVHLKTTSKSENSLLFHNGTWREWQESIMPFSGESDFPDGTLEDWSDSRALAYMTYKTNKGFLKFIDEKIAIMEPDGSVKIYGNWDKHKTIWSSNLNHVKTTTYHGRDHYLYGDENEYWGHSYQYGYGPFHRTKTRDDIVGA